MEKKVMAESADFNKYFKGLDIIKRISVIEMAGTLLKVQQTDAALLADAIPRKERQKPGKAE